MTRRYIVLEAYAEEMLRMYGLAQSNEGFGPHTPNG